MNIDTGCVFGGRLTALRYPEKEWFQFPRIGSITHPRKPFLAGSSVVRSTTHSAARAEDLLDIDDVIGKRIIDNEATRQPYGPRRKCDRCA